MSHFGTTNTMKLMQTGLGLRERLERWMAARYHAVTVRRLQQFRRQLEEDMQPENWTLVEAPLPLIIADLCGALRLDESEQARVLGAAGAQALTEFLEDRPVLRPYSDLNERQVRALDHVRRHGRITNREYRELCPDVSPETARLDLVGLAARGLLTRNGSKRGTHYVLPK